MKNLPLFTPLALALVLGILLATPAGATLPNASHPNKQTARESATFFGVGHNTAILFSSLLKATGANRSPDMSDIVTFQNVTCSQALYKGIAVGAQPGAITMATAIWM